MESLRQWALLPDLDNPAVATVLVEVSSVHQKVIAKKPGVNGTIIWKSNGKETEGGSRKVPIVTTSKTGNRGTKEEKDRGKIRSSYGKKKETHRIDGDQ